LLTGLDHSELLAENLSTTDLRPPADTLQELTHLAMTREELSFLAAELFEILRKITGQQAAVDFLSAIQVLAVSGNPAGARLLAAFLDVSTPGERLVPSVRPLSSCRRFQAGLAGSEGGLGPLQSDWLKRLAQAEAAAAELRDEQDICIEQSPGNDPRQQHPWPLLRGVFGHLLDRAVTEEFWAEEQGPGLLGDLLRLEVDARQERISLLAGNIHPFRVDSVARVLPILNRADAEIRDLRMMITWVIERDFESAFTRPQPRWRETLEGKDWNHVLRDLGNTEALAGMARLAHGLTAQPILLPHLAAGIRLIMDLSEALMGEGVRDSRLDLFTASLLAQSHYGNGQIVFAVEQDLADAITAVLPAPEATDHPLHGLSVLAGLLIIELDGDLTAGEHGLPCTREFTESEELDLRTWRFEHKLLDAAELEAMQAEVAPTTEQENEDEDEEVDGGSAALKHLVLTNIQSLSVLLGFLRDTKITSIPGLVEEVVNRTRNPQVIATIASDRALHTGFANKGVAVACLRSPVNVPVKTLRKFCHVKFVSKVELKRMANDRTGIRKEIAREITMYLEALA